MLYIIALLAATALAAPPQRMTGGPGMTRPQPTGGPRPTGDMHKMMAELLFKKIDADMSKDFDITEFEQFYFGQAGFDVNRNTAIDGNEFVAGFTRLSGVPETVAKYIFKSSDCADECDNLIKSEDVKAIFDSFDPNGNKIIDEAEFGTALQQAMGPDAYEFKKRLEVIAALFKGLDADMNGDVSEAEWNAEWKKNDQDGDMIITLKEYVTVWMKVGMNAMEAKGWFMLSDCADTCDDMITKEDVMKIFEAYAAGDKLISKDEFKNGFLNSFKMLAEMPKPTGNGMGTGMPPTY